MTPDPQRRCDFLFQEFTAGRISRREYMRRMDLLGGSIRIPDGLRRRLDRRTLGEFALFIFDNTRRERFLAETLGTAVFGDFAIEDLGVANDGRVILNPSPGTTGRADFRANVAGDRFPLELKYAKNPHFVTFKDAELRNYEAKPGVRLLIVWGDAQIGPNGDPDAVVLDFSLPPSLRWFVMDAEGVGLMRRKGRFGHYECYGGKPGYRMTESDVLRHYHVKEIPCSRC